jgi:outer membrane murein-binding lipoprotein Lpp
MAPTTKAGRSSAVAGTVIAIGVASALLAGCSHGSSGPAKTTAATTKAATTVPKADTIANDPKARPSVSMPNCHSTSSGWTAGGTATNSTDKSTTFTIVVSFTTKQSTVITRGQTKVAVKPGQTKSWTASANFAKTKDVQCVLRGVSDN